MDPIQAGFCNEPHKPYPSSTPSLKTLPKSTTFNPSPTTHFRPRLRFSALFPALHILKDAYARRAGVSLKPVLQPKTQIKVIVSPFHDLNTKDIMHPSHDPFSRARIPYLECSPGRVVKPSSLDLAKWEMLVAERSKASDSVHYNVGKLREEFNANLELATKNSVYPYSTALIPKIEPIADLIFDIHHIYSFNTNNADKLLQLIRLGHTSMDAAYITALLLMLPHFAHYQDPKRRQLPYQDDIYLQLKFLGRRLMHYLAIFGHPESLFQNVVSFQSLNPRMAVQFHYHLYRDELLGILRDIAGAYPDTRAYGHMIALERTRGGNLDRARQYCLQGLERPTRPKGYEFTLIHAGELIIDHTEAMKALGLALELLIHGTSEPENHNDPFPFATKQRLIYKCQGLERLADALFFRAGKLPQASEAREISKFRAEVLVLRRKLKGRLTSMGVAVGEESWNIFPYRDFDDVLFQLLDPEAVLEEEELMQLRPVRSDVRSEVAELQSRLQEEAGSSESEGNIAGVSDLSGQRPARWSSHFGDLLNQSSDQGRTLGA